MGYESPGITVLAKCRDGTRFCSTPKEVEWNPGNLPDLQGKGQPGSREAWPQVVPGAWKPSPGLQWSAQGTLCDCPCGLLRHEARVGQDAGGSAELAKGIQDSWPESRQGTVLFQPGQGGLAEAVQACGRHHPVEGLK